jgi:two-component system cell cycle response regulator
MLQQSNSIQNWCRLRVLPLGFETTEIKRLAGIFRLERAAKRTYAIVNSQPAESADILLVNYDVPSALNEKNSILENTPNAKVVAVSRGPLNEAVDYHIRGMLLAARVLSVLDKVPFQVPTPPLVSPQPMPSDPFTAEQSLPESKPQDTRQEAPVTVATPSQQTDGYRALVVDDSPAIQKSLELNLATLEQIAAIDFADSGESALDKAESTCYDLIFLDVMMPGIDGYETCSRLRKKAEYKKTPIIMVSGKTSPMDEVKGIMAGATTYLAKPVQKDQFQKLSMRVLAWLAEHKRPA